MDQLVSRSNQRDISSQLLGELHWRTQKQKKVKLHCISQAYQSILQNLGAKFLSISEEQTRKPFKLTIEKI